MTSTPEPPPLSEPPPSNRRAFLRKIPRDLISMAVAIAVVLVARSSLANHYVVPSGSMLPTVRIGDRVLVDKTAYGLRLPLANGYLIERAGPARGDVIVLESPDSGIVLLKRVVALPGDTVAVRDGRVSIDGHVAPIHERLGAVEEELDGRSHPVDIARYGGPDFGPVVVPRGRYLVLGDNRGDSRDGRAFGFVARGAILGRAERVYFRDGGLSWVDL